MSPTLAFLRAPRPDGFSWADAERTRELFAAEATPQLEALARTLQTLAGRAGAAQLAPLFIEQALSIAESHRDATQLVAEIEDLF